MKKQFNNTGGFTLIELMLVIGFITVLVGATIPQFVEFNRKSSLTAGARLVVDGIKTAQSLAEGNVQNAGSTVDRYRFDLLRSPSDPSGCYRAYQVSRVNQSGATIPPVLEMEELQCPLVIWSIWSELTYTTVSGEVGGLTGSEQSFRVCYPGVGYYPVTVDNMGRVQQGEFVASSGGCGGCRTSCGQVVSP